MYPVAGLGRMVGGLETVGGHRGLRRLDLSGEVSERDRPSFAGGAGLRAVDEDTKDPGLE